MKRGVERLYRLARGRASCELANRRWDAGTIISYGALDPGPTDTRIFNYRGLTLTMRSILHWVMAASSIEKRQAFERWSRSRTPTILDWQIRTLLRFGHIKIHIVIPYPP
jgi:hypothetical protein